MATKVANYSLLKNQLAGKTVYWSFWLDNLGEVVVFSGDENQSLSRYDFHPGPFSYVGYWICKAWRP